MNSIYLKAIICLSYLLSIFAIPTFAQDSPNELGDSDNRNQISLYLGFHFTSIQDLIYSEMIYNGSSPAAFGLEYQRKTKMGFQAASFQFDNIKIKSTQPLSSSVFHGNKRGKSETIYMGLNYGQAYKLNGSEKIDFYIGGLFEAKFNSTDYQFGLSTREGYFFVNSINPWLTANYTLNEKAVIQATAHLPVIAFAARSEFAAFDNREIQGEQGIDYLYKKGEFAFIDKYLDINLAINVSYQLSSKVDFIFEYQFNYFQFNEPEKIAVLKNNFNTGLSLKF